ncbi:MAG: Eco57I restriction-modification methylase domain-containing protein [Lentisphaeria bacterium]|jgi:hypothetical protein
MLPLDRTLRNQLEHTIKDAREIAEKAARVSLEQLGVGEATPYPHLSDEERALRRRLRAHGRQLGDALNGGQVQSMDRLVEEVAYEHWHRMLFARFLAENNLLMYPDDETPVPITLEDCEALAKEEGGGKSCWELAAQYAAKMLPQIFQVDSPAFALRFAADQQIPLERLLADLPQEVFIAADSLGWVYQFWQAKRKDEVNVSEVKIGARELPAVTQLFTEPYMVAFLLDNALGAWWAHKKLSAEPADGCRFQTEEEVRKYCAIPGVPLDYLRFVWEEQKTGHWLPAAGTFDDWPEQLSELKVLDPCCGSGHFLVAAFLMLVPMRMELEGLSARAAVDAVLRENLHGLELDQRCVELAAFALALTAWKYPDAGGYRALPELQLACSGLSVSVAKDEWKQLGLGKRNLSLALEWMHDIFKNAPVLGSLLNPAHSPMPLDIHWRDIQPLLQQALKQEHSEAQLEIAIVAQGLAKAASLLAGSYHWIITNVPYLARGKHCECLRDFCEKYYPTAKNELATVFLDRCLELCTAGGAISVVMPQNWLFLSSYKKFREKLLKNDTWRLIARLGAGAFETITGEVVKAILFTISRGDSTHEADGLFAAQDAKLIRGLDVSPFRTPTEKAAELLTAEIKSSEQVKQLENPDNAIVIGDLSVDMLLRDSADGLAGILNGDSLRFQRQFWEFNKKNQHFVYQQGTVIDTIHFGGLSKVIEYDDENGHMRLPADFRRERLHDSDQRGNSAWGKWGVAVSEMRVLPSALYIGNKFDSNIGVILPKETGILPAIWCYCSSPEYNEAVRRIDQKLNVTNATLVKVPFDLAYWTQVAAEQYPRGLPKPYSDDPTQWIFHGHPCGSVIWDEEKKWTAQGPLRRDAAVLQVAVARLLGYRWPAEHDTGMELADEQREWVKCCAALANYADADGIVCIPPVRGELSAADRLLNLLAAAYGEAWSNDTLAELLKDADHAGKSLESWLREKFFTQHCKLFQQRPFIWQIWDGLRDGFAVLVNYHKLDSKRLEALIYTYLGDWISRQKQDSLNKVDGAQERLAAAVALKKRLELILAGEAPLDIFVRWKPLAEQPIGWAPDLNDGVRLNIRPFLTVADVGKKGAGILRDKPNLDWKKDRGKDVPSAPWYHLFNGDRINDHHLTLAEKRAARPTDS